MRAPAIQSQGQAAQVENSRAAQAARREAARADAAQKAAQADAAQKTEQAEAARREAARAETARKAAQTESAKPAVTLPKLQLVSRAESTATAREPGPPSPTATAPAPRSAPNLPPSSAPVSGGTVAGSYALQENATALRDYYRSQNIRAAVEQITVNGRPMYRVRIWR